MNDLTVNGTFSAGDLQIVDNCYDIAATTANKVLVLHDDTGWGDGGMTLFENMGSWTNCGYTRNDGTTVMPVPNKLPLPTCVAPRKRLLNIINSWVGNTDCHYGADTLASKQKGLFGSSPGLDGDNLYPIDASSFISSILIGITSPNSSYYNSSNISLGNIGDNYVNDSREKISNTLIKPNGGLGSSELAMWFAQHGRLFALPANDHQAINMLQFGDILFESSSSAAPYDYYNINHCMFVLGTTTQWPYSVITAESASTSGFHEGPGPQIKIHSFANGSNFRVFARPDYGSHMMIDDWTYQYDGYGPFCDTLFFLPLAYIDTDGYIKPSDDCMCTPDYYEMPRQCNSWPYNRVTVYPHTSATRFSSATFTVYEYDEYYNYIAHHSTTFDGSKYPPDGIDLTGGVYLRFSVQTVKTGTSSVFLEDTFCIPIEFSIWYVGM